MSPPHLWIVSVLVLQTVAHTIDCSTGYECQNSILTCDPHEDCTILCTQPEACFDSLITCPQTGDCTIQCQGGKSCQDAVIDATSSTGNLDILCQDSTDHCRNLKVYGSTLATNKGHLNMECNGLVRACINSEINCPSVGNCSVSCENDSSCRWMQISGPNQGDLSVSCDGSKSCFDAIFNAAKSTKLSVTGCTAYQSCLDLTLFCPPRSNDKLKNCAISGNDYLGKDNAGGTKIYAVNGWKDVEMTYSGLYGASHGGKMYCGADYSISCDIAADAWTCANYQDHCNFHTNSPSAAPTNNPSMSPTIPTAEPTPEPTNKPTKPSLYYLAHQSTDNGNAQQIETGNVQYFRLSAMIAIGTLICCILGMCFFACKNRRLLAKSLYSPKIRPPSLPMEHRPVPTIVRRNTCASNINPFQIVDTADLENMHEEPTDLPSLPKRNRMNIAICSEHTKMIEHVQALNVATNLPAFAPADAYKSDAPSPLTSDNDHDESMIISEAFSNQAPRNSECKPFVRQPYKHQHLKIPTSSTDVSSRDRGVSHTTDFTAASTQTVASVADIHEKNILFLNPCMDEQRRIISMIVNEESSESEECTETTLIDSSVHCMATIARGFPSNDSTLTYDNNNTYDTPPRKPLYHMH